MLLRDLLESLFLFRLISVVSHEIAPMYTYVCMYRISWLRVAGGGRGCTGVAGDCQGRQRFHNRLYARDLKRAVVALRDFL